MNNNIGNVIDTKMVWCRDGFMYQLCRKRKGIIDTISLTYPVKSGLKTISRSIISPLGCPLQMFLETVIPTI
ncbi:hypothetical protein Cpap_0443 [Ruminiclostridium papyrosolvens DSM 2782]|uniref:Uncharacterized protein n=1 Tax=Ruminiclostridium papyrosolvens DSM 2782 TaxID=588581 RepID=F1THE6_9FIRM|nr:hypothetical protein [Ruminiclostridium papyrosolvens]EGD46149.1 hypothetical protein Cpap_0443 [Ruminiclostridium papyrosolvens DSM 2782]WES35934.1 hypothetical protein P0092_08215 [Ruminiclostridium papyrosolvens DSM 2782]